MSAGTAVAGPLGCAGGASELARFAEAADRIHVRPRAAAWDLDRLEQAPRERGPSRRPSERGCQPVVGGAPKWPGAVWIIVGPCAGAPRPVAARRRSDPRS